MENRLGDVEQTTPDPILNQDSRGHGHMSISPRGATTLSKAPSGHNVENVVKISTQLLEDFVDHNG